MILRMDLITLYLVNVQNYNSKQSVDFNLFLFYASNDGIFKSSPPFKAD